MAHLTSQLCVPSIPSQNQHYCRDLCTSVLTVGLFVEAETRKHGKLSALRWAAG